MTVLYAFLVVGLLGGLLGVGLAFASRALAVQKDKRVEEVEDALPGLNCGACGYAGCAAYAEAVAEGEAPLTLCSPGGPTAAEELGRIMGVEVEVSARKMVAQVHCRGGHDVSEYTFDYHGLQDCTALHLMFGGDKVCKNSCLGLGTCIRVCPVDAIGYDDEGKVWVDRDICISCGKCIEVCPTGVMKWIPYDADYIVACNNTDPAKVVRKHCKVGCIACGICVKRSPEGGFVIENNLSSIDYSSDGDRSAAAEKCPPKCIIAVTPPSEEPADESAPEAAAEETTSTEEAAPPKEAAVTASADAATESADGRADSASSSQPDQS